MNKKIVTILVFLLLSLFSQQAFSGKQDDYDQCILGNLQGVKYDWMSQEIRRICKENYLNTISPSKKRERYNECVLTHLHEVESEQAASHIIKACKSKHL